MFGGVEGLCSLTRLHRILPPFGVQSQLQCSPQTKHGSLSQRTPNVYIMSSKDPTPPTEGSKSAQKKAAKLAAAAEKKAAKGGDVAAVEAMPKTAAAGVAGKATPQVPTVPSSFSQLQHGQDSLNADNVELVGKDVVQKVQVKRIFFHFNTRVLSAARCPRGRWNFCARRRETRC